MLNFGIGPAQEMAHVIATFGSMGPSITFVVDPLVAKICAPRASKPSRKPANGSWRIQKFRWGTIGKARRSRAFAKGLAAQGVEPFATWAKLPKDALITPRLFVRRVNILVVGGETNPMWITTDFTYTRSVSIDQWRPKAGIRHDARPLRMPAPVTCKDGTCGIPETAPAPNQ